MKMIEMGMSQQNQIDWRQIVQMNSGALQPLQKKKPVREIRIDQRVHPRELDQERGMTNPGQRQFAPFQLGEIRFLGRTRATRPQRLPDHLMEKLAGIKVVAGSQLLE